MGIHPDHLLTDVIRPTLAHLGPPFQGRTAELLLLGTAAQESHLGTYLHQIGGPALGIFQMEPATHTDIWANYLRHREDVAAPIHRMASTYPTGSAKNNEMVWNLRYACAMARIHYYRVPEALPELTSIPYRGLSPTSIEALGHYHKQHYNTPAGKATVRDFVANWQRLISGKVEGL